jgi:hypothetical protein
MSEMFQRKFNRNGGVYGSPPEPVIGPAIAGPVGEDDRSLRRHNRHALIFRAKLR